MLLHGQVKQLFHSDHFVPLVLGLAGVVLGLVDAEWEQEDFPLIQETILCERTGGHS